MKKLLALACLLWSFCAHATVYFISDCQTGADPACVAGANANAGTLSTLPKQTYTQLSLVAGDQVLLAKGGAWIVATNSPSCASCVVGNGLLYSTYTPIWGPGTAKPLILPSSNSAIAVFINNPGGADYTWSGWHFKGNGTTQTSIGFYVFTGATNITLDGVEVDGWLDGIISREGSGSANFILRNSSVHDNLDIGFLGGGDGVLIENNTFDNNGYFTGSTGSHNVYLSAGNPVTIPGRKVIVRGNTLTRSVQTSGSCNAVSLVAHSAFYGLVIENNIVDESADVSGALPTCYGIAISAGDHTPNERYEGAIIRGNKVINVGNIGISVGNCPYCVVENNIVVWTTAAAFSVTGIKLWNQDGAGWTTYINQWLVVRNNSVYEPPNNFAGNIGISVITDGTNHRVFNNVVYFPTTSSASSTCYNTLPLTAFITWDYNLCFRVGGVNIYSNLYNTLALAQAAGADINGSVSDPTLTATPAIGNGYDIAFTNGLTKNGGRSPCPLTTIGGFKRAGLGACDIGAHQQGASVLVPNSPTGVH